MLVEPGHQSPDSHFKDSAHQPTVIIGAGPAGLTAALCLTRRGHQPVVLESDTTPSTTMPVRPGAQHRSGGERDGGEPVPGGWSGTP